MKASRILFIILLFAIQNVIAQERKLDTQTSQARIITNLDVKFYANSTQEVLIFQSDDSIEMITFFDKQGNIVLQQAPTNNQIAINALKPGFYLLCTYCNGTNIKRGILKKV